MTIKSKPKSDAFEAIHSAARGLHRTGVIGKATMRDFDKLCFQEMPEIDATGVKRIRERVRVSQSIFARYLNTSESTIQKWETGQKRPSGMAVKLLHVVSKHGLKVLA